MCLALQKIRYLKNLRPKTSAFLSGFLCGGCSKADALQRRQVKICRKFAVLGGFESCHTRQYNQGAILPIAEKLSDYIVYPIGLFADDSRRMSLALKLRSVFGVFPFKISKTLSAAAEAMSSFIKSIAERLGAKYSEWGMLSIPIIFILSGTEIPFS